MRAEPYKEKKMDLTSEALAGMMRSFKIRNRRIDPAIWSCFSLSLILSLCFFVVILFRFLCLLLAVLASCSPGGPWG